MLTIGTHMSIAKGLAKTAENVVWMGANTMQIFSRNPRGSNYKVYSKQEIEAFQKIRKENSFGALLAHAPYTMNLASGQERVYEFACTVIREDIARMRSAWRIWSFIRAAIRGSGLRGELRILYGDSTRQLRGRRRSRSFWKR